MAERGSTTRDTLESDSRLRLTEIFYSIQGESRPAGFPTVFVRLTGCPLRCVWCDTTYSFHGGDWYSLEAVMESVAAYPARHVCVTGGEPLAQPNVHRLLGRLCDAGYETSLETSGALDIAAVDDRVHVVLDLKAPGSGEVERNLWSNIEHLDDQDQVKIVVADRQDFDWAVERIGHFNLTERCSVLVSPAMGSLEPKALAEWVLESGLPLRFQIQLHKVVWGDEPGH